MEYIPQIQLSTERKGGGNRTTYNPLEMSDISVYEMARHWYSLSEVAEAFNVSVGTILDKHGDAFRAGKLNGMNKPRMLLNKILSDFMDNEGNINFARPDVPIHNLLKAIELHAKKYEGMGSKQTVVHESKTAYDAVESLPVIIEKP